MHRRRPGPNDAGLHIVELGVDLDPQGRTPEEIVRFWRDFARAEAAAATAPGIRITIAQAAWKDDRRQVEGIDCHFVREPHPLVRLPGQRVLYRMPRHLYARVQELDPDIIHFAGLAFSRQIHGIRQLFPDRLIVAQDRASRVPAGLRRRYMRWGLAGLDAVMFCAREQAEPFKTAGILRSDLPVFEVTEVSSPFSPGDRVEARAATGLAGDPCLFSLGHLDDNKDPLMVLNAVASAAASLPDLRLYMCYRKAPLITQVRQRIEQDPVLRTRVRLLGEIPYPEIQPHLRAADFLVQGSHHEGSSYGAIEALACGTSPLVTDIASFRRITDNGRVGAIVPVGQSDALARAIVEWTRKDRPALRREARAYFERELSIEAVGRQLRESYQSMVEGRW